MPAETNKLYVGNFPYDTTEEELRDVFEEYGEVRAVRIVTDMETSKSKGFAFIEMATTREAEAALARDAYVLNGRRLRVGYAKPKSGRSEANRG